jgi:retron-type reverse transcriptase
MIVYKELSSIEKDLGYPAKTLYGLSNNLENHYHNVFIPKSDGTKRKLSVPDLILKNVQRAIADNILAHYPVSKYATAYKVGSSVQKNARPHVKKEKILKLDIEGFFDNIIYSKVKDIVFYEEKYSEPIRILLTMLCYYRESLPQGAPTSPAITNIMMYDFDERIGAYCSERGIAYTRYCDDMTFSGAFDEKEVIAVVKAELQKLGLFLKNRKTAIISNTKRQTVTGIVVNEKINLTKEYKKKIRQEMYYIKRFGIDSHLKKIRILEKEQYIDSLLGRIAFVLQTIPKDDEFLEYKNLLQTYIKGELNP